MAARLNPRHQDMIREKIRASQLVNVLEDHVLGDRELSSTQVNSALGLLKKVVPDLKAVDHDGTIQLTFPTDVNVNVVKPAKDA